MKALGVLDPNRRDFYALEKNAETSSMMPMLTHHSRLLHLAMFVIGLSTPVFAQEYPGFQPLPKNARWHWVRHTELKTNQETLPDRDRLDVSIAILGTNLPKKERSKQRSGIFPWVRKTEALAIPVQLMETLQASNHWGAVHVVPGISYSAEIQITGKIIKAHGLKQVLVIEVRDSTGKRWFRKRFSQICDRTLPMDEWFQPLYNRIANTMLKARQKLERTHLESIPRVASLRFAKEFVPIAYRDYLEVSYDGRNYYHRLNKLPSKDDPLIALLDEIRARDQMLLEALSASFQDYRTRTLSAYHQWQMSSYRNREPHVRSGVTSGRSMFYGFNWNSRHIVNRLSYRIEPLLLELKGQTSQLTSSAEDQYATWRKLLAEIFAEESGLHTLKEETKSGAPGKLEAHN